MPAKLERCVKEVEAKGDVDNAWAVCQESINKKKKKDVKKARGMPTEPWANGPPEPMTDDQLEQRRREKFCDDCGEKRPCSCDKASQDHISEQWEEAQKSLFPDKTVKKDEVEVKYREDAPEMCSQCKKNQVKGGSPMCFQCNLKKAWQEFKKHYSDHPLGMCRRCQDHPAVGDLGLCQECANHEWMHGEGDDGVEDVMSVVEDYKKRKLNKSCPKSMEGKEHLFDNGQCIRCGHPEVEKEPTYDDDGDEYMKKATPGIPGNPQARNKKTKPVSNTTDWEAASMDEERHQDEINESMGNESDYDEAAAYAHELDDLDEENDRKAIEQNRQEQSIKGPKVPKWFMESQDGESLDKAWKEFEKAHETVVRNEDNEPIGTERHAPNYSDNDDDPYAQDPPMNPEQIEEENRAADAAWERRKARKMKPTPVNPEVQDEMRHVEDMKNYPSNDQEQDWNEANEYMGKAWEEFKKSKYCSKCGNFYNQREFKTCPFCKHGSVPFNEDDGDPAFDIAAQYDKTDRHGDFEKAIATLSDPDLLRAWKAFTKEWKPYKEWIKDKEEAKNAPKKPKVDKKDKPWKKK